MKVIVLTAWNRPGYLRESLESWARADRMDGYQMIVRLEPGNRAVRQVLSDFEDRIHLSIVENPTRLGVLTNPHAALTDGFSTGARFVVYSEEDVVVSNDVLRFYEWADKRFWKRKAVLTVNAVQRFWTPGDGEDEHTATAARRFAPTGWATWVDRWESILSPEWQHDYRGWDWHINQTIVASRGYRTVLPSYARSQHIGRDGGVHMTPKLFESHLCPTFRPVFEQGEWREI